MDASLLEAAESLPSMTRPEMPAPSPRKRIMIVQYAGDFREAYQRLMETGEETYFGHGYILGQLERAGRDFGEVAIMCCLSPEEYHETLPSGLTVIGARAHPRRERAKVERLIAEWNPTHLVVLGPLTGIIRWGLRTGRKVSCVFADSFEINPLMRYLKFGRLAHVLNNPGVGWVANHGVNACASLARIGVAPEKIIAWDYIYHRDPAETPPRTRAPGREATLLYVGSLQPKKGVGDAITAVAKLRAQGNPIRLKVVGGGGAEPFRALAAGLAGGDGVEFLGVIPNARVFELMKECDAVVVPSRHDYPEGMPLTIYESLCARAPIIASDHPMFRGHLVDRETAIVFPARDVDRLAAGILALLDSPELYARLSANSGVVWERLRNPVKWGDVLNRGLSGTSEDLRWFEDNRQFRAGRS